MDINNLSNYTKNLIFILLISLKIIDKFINNRCHNCHRELMEAFHDLQRLRLDATGGQLVPILELD